MTKSIIEIVGQNIRKDTSIREVAEWYKSMNEEKTTKHKVISKAEVDSEPWLTVKCNKEVAKWVRKQKTSWHEHIDQQWNFYLNTFDISEELYMLMVLKFGR